MSPFFSAVRLKNNLRKNPTYKTTYVKKFHGSLIKPDNIDV
jgi:hypothetical protein